MTALFNLEITSPDRVIPAQSVVQAVIPGAKGKFGVLAGHAPMVVELKSGVVNVYKKTDSNVTSRFFISAGFAEVTFTDCILLVDSVTPMGEMNTDTLTQELEAVSQALEKCTPDQATELEEKQNLIIEKLTALHSLPA